MKKLSVPLKDLIVTEDILSVERMYPPIKNVTSQNYNITGQASGNGFYVTSFKSTFGVGVYDPWNCFNTNDSIGDAWGFSDTRRYILPAETFRNTLTDNIVSGYTGDWSKIKFPLPINLTK